MAWLPHSGMKPSSSTSSSATTGGWLPSPACVCSLCRALWLLRLVTQVWLYDPGGQQNPAHLVLCCAVPLFCYATSTDVFSLRPSIASL